MHLDYMKGHLLYELYELFANCQHGVYLEYMYYPYCLHFNRHAIIQVFEGLSPNRTATLIF